MVRKAGTKPRARRQYGSRLFPPAPLTGDVGRDRGDAGRALLFLIGLSYFPIISPQRLIRAPTPSAVVRSYNGTQRLGIDRSLSRIKAAPWTLNSRCVMAHVIIHCPQTSSKVQVWVPEVASTDGLDSYEAVTCPACTRLHFINKITGKLLGDTKE